MTDQVLIDRKVLENLQERLDPHIDAVAWGAVYDALTAPVQRVSVPDGWRELAKRADDFLYSLPETDGVLRLRADLCSMLAAPAAPADDAWMVAIEWAKDAEEWGPALNEAGWLFLSELNEDPQKSALIFNSTKGPLRAAIMKYAEIVTAHRAQGVV